MSKANDDNRANQLNPTHDAYYQARGYDGRGGFDKQQSSDGDSDTALAAKASARQAHRVAQLQRDNRSNQLNPTHAEYAGDKSEKLALDNRANQLNPNHASYTGSK